MEQSKLKRGISQTIRPDKLSLLQRPNDEYTRHNSVLPVGRQNSAMRNSEFSGTENDGLSPNLLNQHQRSENEGGDEARPRSIIPVNDA